MRQIAFAFFVSAFAAFAHAAPTDVATSPLANSMSANVKPNVMFILDDSGSMGWRYMPDNVNDGNVDKPRCSDTNCNGTTTSGLEGNPPWYTALFNRVTYNPQITYAPAVDASGAALASYGAPWTSVPVNAFIGSGTINLLNGYPEIVYCKNANDDASGNAGNCRRNGIDTPNPFPYNTASTANGYPDGTGNGAFRHPRTRTGSPFYYDLVPAEHCSDPLLTTCTLSATPTGTYVYPAPLRYCKTSADANSAGAVSGSTGGSARCQSRYASTHTRPRYGKFRRVDIVPSTAAYGNRPDRTDCAARPSCTYAEEMTNFANWYAYYSTRMQLMKSGAGRAFTTLDGRFRVGLVTINPGDGDVAVSAGKYLKIDTFAGDHRDAWFKKFYAQDPGNRTPLREALSRVGRHFAGITDGINQGMNDDPVQYSCQANIALLSTDGYWNSNAGQRLDATGIGNLDNTDAGYSTRAAGAYDGNLAGASDTLADVALYYYTEDLRKKGATGAFGTDVSENNVPTSTRDTNPQQHMVTFTLGLGVDGLMQYVPNYDMATVGDFFNVKSGSNNCWWGSGGKCNWPVPASDSPTAIDDLWHAAVNGRGRYVSARDSVSLVEGLTGALNELKVVVGAAAASATSSPNVTSTDNAVYSSTFRTVKWDGELVAQKIEPTTGKVLPTAAWSARDKLNAAVGGATDSRTIYTTTGGTLKPFRYVDLDAAARSHFDGKCASLSQCATLTAIERAVADSGVHLVNYLRGQRQHEAGVFRARDYVLGDMAGSRPAFVRDPRRAYGDAVVPPYSEFKNANKSRKPMVYIGSNGGMLHAFDADTGAELWSVVPRSVLPRLHQLADAGYASAHEYFVDGSPSVADAYINGAWRTVLVVGLNAGGRGFLALDVTNPAAPTLLWEICADATLCAISDENLGLSFGNPVVTKRASDGRWVALLTSGYNNVSPGDGRGYLYVVDLVTGVVLERVSTGSGSPANPSGFARISAWVKDPNADNTATYVYGGDLDGSLWRFDLTTYPVTAMQLATLKDAAGKPQPVTTRPELGQIDSHRVVYFGTGRFLGVSDLQDPATLTPPGSGSYLAAVYALKDSGVPLGNPRAGAIVTQIISEVSATTRRASSNPVNWSTNLGWVADLPSTGERVNIDPQLALGTLVVTANVPNDNACSAGGDSWIYQFGYRTGSAVSTATDGIVGNKRTGTLTVGNAIVRLPDGSLKMISTGASGVKETYGVNVDSGAGNPRRINWRELTR